jgi:hypothetical protein
VIVYVAGPIGLNDAGRAQRVADALRVGEALRRAGLYPFVPHLLDEPWRAISEHTYECWMRYDDAFLRASKAVYRMPGESPGADREVAVAEVLSIPVFYNLAALLEWSRK